MKAWCKMTATERALQLVEILGDEVILDVREKGLFFGKVRAIWEIDFAVDEWRFTFLEVDNLVLKQ